MFDRFKKPRTISVFSPTTGRLLPLTEVPDPVFSTGVIGQGFAVEPTDGVFRAPVDGELTMVAATAHAFGIRTADGMEVLVHIGIDTVKLKGQFLSAALGAGTPVRAGDPVITADLERIAPLVPSLVTPVVVTNTTDFPVPEPELDAPAGESVLRIARAAR